MVRMVRRAAGTKRGGTSMTDRRVAVLLGVDDYPGSPLTSCLRDVAAMDAALRDQATPYEIFILRDGQVTLDAVYDLLAEIRAMDAKFVLFYFSGHGVHIDDVDSYLCTHDARPNNPGLALTMLPHLLPRTVTHDTAWLAVLDCCHAGSVRLWDRSTPGIERSHVDRALATADGHRAVIGACAAEQSAVAAANRPSMFTDLFVQGLRGAVADASGEVTLIQAYDWTSDRMREMAAPPPVFAGDLRGKWALASGLAPRGRAPLADGEIAARCRDGERLIDDYRNQQRVLSRTWLPSGWSEACRRLEPIIGWLDEQVREHPELANTADFQRLRRNADRELGYVSMVAEGTHTPFGVLRRTLGRGAFGTVWEAQDEEGGRVAYKIYHSDQLDVPEKLKRFRRGYEAMRQLSHPNVVSLIRYTEVPVAIAMEYVDGPDLRTLGKIEQPHELLAVLDGIAAGLEHAHQFKVRHRDVKPENVVLRYDEQAGLWHPVLTDFDLAWYPAVKVTHLTKAGIGQAYYAAPEQIQRPGSDAARAEAVDVYAFGQLAFFTATGFDPIPMSASNISSLQKSIVNTWPHRAASMYLKFYDRATSVAPGERYQAMRNVRQALATIRRELASGHEPAEDMDFPHFCVRLAGQLGGLWANRRSPTEAEIISRTGRVQTLLSVSESEGVQTVSARLTTEILNAKYANHSARLNNSRKIVDAMVKACPAAARKVLRGGFHGAEVLYRVPSLDEALLNRMTTDIRAMSAAAARA